MKVADLHVGMQVRHPQYGLGTVKAINQQGAEIVFNTGSKMLEPSSSQLEPAEAQMSVSGLSRPLRDFLEETVQAAVQAMGVEKPDSVVEELGARWHRGKLVMHPSDPTLQTKEVPLEVFFHKIVMMRNNLRVLEQKVNASEKLTDAEKVEIQQYITKCYGSMTTFNILFKSKTDQFNSKE